MIYNILTTNYFCIHIHIYIHRSLYNLIAAPINFLSSLRVSSRILTINDSLLASNPNIINSSIGVVLIFLKKSHHEVSF